MTISHRKVGGIRFLRIGRLCLMFCWSRKPVSARPHSHARVSRASHRRAMIHRKLQIEAASLPCYTAPTDDIPPLQ